jgi:hypothetical protein
VVKAGPKNTAAKFKVGDEVIRTDRPFEPREIIEQLPVTDTGECQYRIGPSRPSPKLLRDGTVIAPVQTKQRNIGEDQLMKLEEVLDELLDRAKAKKDGATRNALLAALWRARLELTKELPSPERVGRLEKSIERTEKLLAELTARYGIPDHVLCEVGAGIVDVWPLPVVIPELIPFEIQALKEGTAIVKIQDLLRYWNGIIKQTPRKKRYGQTKEYMTAIVKHAVQFSCQHLGIEPSTNPSNPIQEFAERFYARVTGTEPKRSLDYQIRKALSALGVSTSRRNTQRTGD